MPCVRLQRERFCYRFYVCLPDRVFPVDQGEYGEVALSDSDGDMSVRILCQRICCVYGVPASTLVI